MIKTPFRSQAMLLLALLFGSSIVVSPFASSAQEVQVVRPPQDYSYLTNPGIGWQHKPGIGDQLLPESVAYINRDTISWRILNPDEGVFDWEVLDQQIEDRVAAGKQASFRIYTMQGESFGGHQVPDWVLDKGATILEVGDPDYSSCVYQEEWGNFVEALRQRYDGNPNIAFIDISGYGNFNEWSWIDEVIEWDDLWETRYAEGTASRATLQTVDGQTRRRLVDMFIGGQFEGHECRDAEGNVETVNYNYPGFTSTQLVMPFAGVRQSIQYLATQRDNVGFRHDCLGRDGSIESISSVLDVEMPELWQQAPVIYEFCAYGLDEEYLTRADRLLRASHASVVHDNIEHDSPYRDSLALEEIMRNVGYRYVLEEASFPSQSSPGEELPIVMDWVNVGYAPAYPLMGQDFMLFVKLESNANGSAAQFEIDTDISEWMPSDNIDTAEPPNNHIEQDLLLPDDLVPGIYQVSVTVMDLRRDVPILLAIYGRDIQGWYTLGMIEVVGSR